MKGTRMFGRLLLEGQDYHLHFVRFPNRANRAQVWPNPDGTYDIYLNTLYFNEEDRLKASFQHELRHILLQHFEAVGIPIQQIEAEADGDVESKLSLHDFLHPPDGMIPCFGSEEAMGRWLGAIVRKYDIRL